VLFLHQKVLSLRRFGHFCQLKPTFVHQKLKPTFVLILTPDCTKIFCGSLLDFTGWFCYCISKEILIAPCSCFLFFDYNFLSIWCEWPPDYEISEKNVCNKAAIFTILSGGHVKGRVNVTFLWHLKYIQNIWVPPVKTNDLQSRRFVEPKNCCKLLYKIFRCGRSLSCS